MKTTLPVSSSEKIDKNSACKKCLRPQGQCICGKVTSLNASVKVLILQHPREQYKLLNSAMLAHLALANSVLRVGLSWRNLSHALGEEADPQKWGILFLKGIIDPSRKIELYDTQKKRLLPIKTRFEGIVVLDGSWKQAKTMWWRNPWLLKLTRITLNPVHKSMRGQVKKEGLATVEAVALALDCLGEDVGVGESLRKQYEEKIIKLNSGRLN
ncbi:MAG TPA: tRNA-uridine aminocarboxypropyltransferase [Chitinivibrionales bacterium]|nr:tRNA-uridine aminocarboxypropyltransferase [Chitinivibrionales bacterium]